MICKVIIDLATDKKRNRPYTVTLYNQNDKPVIRRYNLTSTKKCLDFAEKCGFRRTEESEVICYVSKAGV